MSSLGCTSSVISTPEYCPSGEQKADYVDRLIATLRHAVPDRAGLAIDVLAYMLGEPRAIEPLIALLYTTPDMAVLKQAVLALGRFRDQRAIAPLTELLSNADSPLVARHAAVEALAQIGGREAEAGIAISLSDPSPPVRKLAEVKLAAMQRGRGG